MDDYEKAQLIAEAYAHPPEADETQLETLSRAYLMVRAQASAELAEMLDIRAKLETAERERDDLAQELLNCELDLIGTSMEQAVKLIERLRTDILRRQNTDDMSNEHYDENLADAIDAIDKTLADWGKE